MQPASEKAKYHFNADSEFIIENYNFAKPFANFFPGIAGKYGIPMWVFYVNRGQAIASFGTSDKDHAILEFQPANKSWYLVFSLGFRTFIKVHEKKSPLFYEPFHNGYSKGSYQLSNRMKITPYDLIIEEENASLGLKTTVEYFTIPQDSYAALARKVTIQNTSKKAKTLELLDGLPQVVPYGVANLFLKKLSRTIEAWMDVENLDRGVPFFKLDVDPTDRPQVLHIEGGNFYAAFTYNKANSAKILEPIVDPQAIFGAVTDFTYPRCFIESTQFAVPRSQIAKNKTPCAFSLLGQRLPPSGSLSLYSLVGTMRDLKTLNASMARITACSYLDRKKEENKQLVEELLSHIETKSSSKPLDLYIQQTYLDNIMRGGYPVTFALPDTFKKTLKAGSDRTVFYLYSRKHGDLERDYNKFHINPTYFSQGNGNYRDVNQNRRNDVWFNPDIQDENVTSFFNLLQADGFNPLVVKGARFVLRDIKGLKEILGSLVAQKDAGKLLSFLSFSFTPGKLIFFIEEERIKLLVSYDELLNVVMPLCAKDQDAEHGEGFWTDHWAYNLDLLESFLGVFPEKLKEVVFEKRAFTFYDNAEIVKPRNQKYLLLDGFIRQFHSVGLDSEKKEMIAKRSLHPHSVRSGYGTGPIYQTTLINKLSCLLVNKLASFDPFGMGIEMEADKPNWFDALNGLPALFGSSACETFELKRLCYFIEKALQSSGQQSVSLSEEIHALCAALLELLQEYLNSSSEERDYLYWDKATSLKEQYREKTRLGFSGKEIEISAFDLIQLLQQAVKKIDIGLAKLSSKNNDLFRTYFINEVAAYEPINSSFIKPTKFVQRPLPLFLQGQVEAMKMSAEKQQALSIYRATRQSKLYDKALKMYKVTASLKEMPEEIGRCRVFTPGWLENESIWLHMEYKFLLEILKQGLYAEFYRDFKDILIPFQKPERYGRSILENASFLVSSSYPDKKLHGNGFVARLSGSTAEFIHIWLLMSVGAKPFFLNEKNELQLQFEPVLAGWLFDAKGLYSFTFLSTVRVTYHNPKRKDTFGENGACIQKINFDDAGGNQVAIDSSVIPAPYAGQIRSRSISRIDIYLA